ncbi:MAG: adenylosuccinate lyase [Gammaproteobacteria bacterium]|nr:adenylosuccinate lyase [Gammaproteobacteria bacterium]MDH4313725.1 adenylosuccinate lyase [Gammaproteobacteria bacterium]MDH5212969.1 adenylosuccinate lyase [Gammaproteobacteria bacterium]MDH5502028.1 adenylosuccinate lyase [Gammaproteobacteria bacterium]
MELTSLKALSPADGRYADKVQGLRGIFSEYGLIRFRVLVEIRWLQWLADDRSIVDLEPLSPVMKDMLNHIVDGFSTDDASRIKKIEAKTNHDVKAVEYYIRERIGSGKDAKNLADFIHFACTSEDINNLAYALMLRTARDEILVPRMKEIVARLRTIANENAAISMMSRTHGQTASPTTVGKEFANVIERLHRAQEQFSAIRVRGKFNGAVGNFNAHVVAYPETDWAAVSSAFVESLGLEANLLTTQIEPHDWTAEYCHALIRFNTVLIDLCRDVWGYVSLGYFTQRVAKDEVGSSTMPHKVNPIDFENAEGNLGLANALLDHFALKLPISRWQRDLTDSTVQRNFGVAIAYVAIAIQSLLNGLGKLQVNSEAIARDIDDNWEVLGEAVQTVMRRYGIAEPYEKLKALTRGRKVTKQLLHEFIAGLEIPDDAKTRLLALTPSTYTGLAAGLARRDS